MSSMHVTKSVDVRLVVRMNGVVKTDESDSLAGDMPESAVSKPGQESAVIQPPGIGPAIHLNGSACPVQEDQPVQVCTDYNSHNTEIHMPLAAFLAYFRLLFTLILIYNFTPSLSTCRTFKDSNIFYQEIICSPENYQRKHYI